jgi:hypothetical protein
MENIHHKPIKMFSLDGIIIDDTSIGRLKQEYIRLLKSEMVLTGYVPRLDIDIDWTLDYNHQKQYYQFEISMYGVYIGKSKSQWTTGIDGTKIVPSLKSKSREFSQDQA